MNKTGLEIIPINQNMNRINLYKHENNICFRRRKH